MQPSQSSTSHPMGSQFQVLLKWSLQVLLLTACAVVSASGLKLDHSVSQQNCAARGGLPQFELHFINPPDSTTGRSVLTYTGCWLPDENNPLPNHPHGPIGPLLDLQIFAPKASRPGVNIASGVHVVAVNEGDRPSPATTVTITLARAPDQSDPLTLASISLAPLAGGRLRDLRPARVLIPADRFGDHVLCATANPTGGSQTVCASITILRKPPTD